MLILTEARLEDGRLALEENRDIVAQLTNELIELKRNVDDETRLKQEMAELDAKIDHAQELNRGAQMRIQQQMEHSKLLDAEIKTIGWSSLRGYKNSLTRRRGEARPTQQAGS
jgi:arginine/lysine/ornithine decarboxylase